MIRLRGRAEVGPIREGRAFGQDEKTKRPSSSYGGEKERERNTEMPYLLTTTDGTERGGMEVTGNGRGCAGREIGTLGFLFILIFLDFFHSIDVVRF